MREISLNANHIHGQPMFKVIDKVKRLEALGRKIVHLEIGDPDFSSLQHIIDAAKQSLDAGNTALLQQLGDDKLVKAIRSET
jgi:aspartate aminotransferase